MITLWKDILKSKSLTPVDGEFIVGFTWIGEYSGRKIAIVELRSGHRMLFYISKEGNSGKQKGTFYPFRNTGLKHPKVDYSRSWMAKYKDDIRVYSKHRNKLNELYAEGKLPKYETRILEREEVNKIARRYGVKLGHPNPKYKEYYVEERDG